MGWKFNRTIQYASSAAIQDVLPSTYHVYVVVNGNIDVLDYWVADKALTAQYGDDNYIFDHSDNRTAMTKVTTIACPITVSKLVSGNSGHIWGIASNTICRINTLTNQTEMYFGLGNISASGKQLFEANKIWFTSNTTDSNDFNGLYYFDTANLLYPNMNFYLYALATSTNIVRCQDTNTYVEQFTVNVNVDPVTNAVTYTQAYTGNNKYALTGFNVNIATAVTETITFTMIDDTTFSVVGSVTGAYPNYTVGTYDGISSRIAIPVLKNGSKEFGIASAYNGYIYITNYNAWKICKFNAVTGAFVNTIDMQNRDITSILTNSNKEIYVSSRNGLLSLVNSTTDAVTHPFGTGSNPVSPTCMVDDGNYFWFTETDASGTRLLYRLKKADKTLMYMNASSGDYKLDVTNFKSSANLQKMFSMPEYSYKSWDETSATFVTKYMHSYIFIVDGLNLIGFRNYNTLYRENKNITRGVAMLSLGPNDYTGD